MRGLLSVAADYIDSAKSHAMNALLMRGVMLKRMTASTATLANVTSGQVLRLEGFRHGIGRAVNYRVVSGDASRPAGIHR